VQSLEDKFLQLEVTSRVLGICLSITWLSSALLFPSEGVEEDILLFLGLSLLRIFLLGFLPHEVFQNSLCVSIVFVIASLLVILFM
jgi:hypothetical protein